MVVIAIDGPAASGKSSTARAVANTLGFHHVDSGSLYRAVTAARARSDGAPARWTEDDVLDAAQLVTLEATPAGFAPRLDGAVLDDELTSAAVTAAVSRVAQMPAVRAWVNARLREVATNRNVVVDGRDMGRTVFPDAKLKVYLDADPWERARRRLIQRDGRSPSDDEITAESTMLTERDSRDSAQSAPANDAVHIDTTSMSQQEQIDRIVSLARTPRY
ncbi:MAG TPA: (d)CMP kinase [Gemmatimonadaceae bacterium]|nr:(d)CMP kinase [Gemmatimonadaceae bacterium]